MKRVASPGRVILYREIRTYIDGLAGKRFLIIVSAAQLVSIAWLLATGGRVASFVAGASTVLIPAIVGYSVLVYGEFAPRLAGVSAEKETLNILRRHEGAEIWRVFPNVQFPTGGDVDMVVVAPRAVLAMEVKWHGRYKPSDKIERSAATAGYRARRLERVLRDLGLSPAVPVLAVLAVWGPASNHVRDGVRKYEDVTVVDGHQPAVWLPRIGTGRVSAAAADEVATLLQRHAAGL